MTFFGHLTLIEGRHLFSSYFFQVIFILNKVIRKINACFDVEDHSRRHGVNPLSPQTTSYALFAVDSIDHGLKQTYKQIVSFSLHGCLWPRQQ